MSPYLKGQVEAHESIAAFIERDCQHRTPQQIAALLREVAQTVRSDEQPNALPTRPIEG